MTIEIRQKVQTALEAAASAEQCRILVKRTDGRDKLMQCDVTCFSDHLEGTDDGGKWVSIAFEEIADVTNAADDTAGARPA
jgi:hypothetical protein